MSSFDSTFLRLLNPHGYKVSVSERLRALKLGFIEKHKMPVGSERYST